MAEKVTEMLLKVHDLECSKCYKKVKKILCKFPQIQDQVYDEKNNTVRIKVVCCSPEKIRDKICCKGRGSIKSIEILKPPEKPPPKSDEKPPSKSDEKPNTAANPPKDEKPNAAEKPPDSETPKVTTKDNTTIVVNIFDVPKPCYVNPPVPNGSCCTECSKGSGGGPCYNPCYGQTVRNCDGHCGRPVCSCGCGGYRGNCGSRCSEYYFDEDNSQGCTIM